MALVRSGAFFPRPAVPKLQEIGWRGYHLKKQQIVRWCVDVALGSVFLVSLLTGLIKLTVLMRVTGIGQVVLPLAWISNVHNTTGVLLCILVFIHLILNRHWIVTTTRRILAGEIIDE